MRQHSPWTFPGLVFRTLYPKLRGTEGGGGVRWGGGESGAMLDVFVSFPTVLFPTHLITLMQ